MLLRFGYLYKFVTFYFLFFSKSRQYQIKKKTTNRPQLAFHSLFCRSSFFKIDTLNYETKLQHAVFSVLGGPPPNSNFHVITQQKLYFQLWSSLLYHFYFNFILFVHTGHASFGFIDVQYLQNVAFSFEKVLNGQKLLLDRFSPPDEKIPALTKFSHRPSSHWEGRFLPYLFNAIWKTMACFTFSSGGVEAIFTDFSV